MADRNGRENGEGAPNEWAHGVGAPTIVDPTVRLRTKPGLSGGGDQRAEAESGPRIDRLRRAGRHLREGIPRALGLFLLVAIIMVTASALVIRASIWTVDWYPRWEDVLLRVAAVFSLSFLPAWLFLRFMKTRAASVWTEYVLNLHRLCVDESGFLPEPPVTSIYHARWQESRERRREEERRAGISRASGQTIYEQKFEAYYGRGTANPNSGGANFKIETYFPVLLCIWIFAIGWVMVLSRNSTFDVATKLNAGDVLAFAFMGGYVFALQMLVRRYFQADLRASAYLNAVVRVMTAVVVAGVVWRSQVAGLLRPGDWSEAQQLAISFGIGFFPIAGLQALQGVFSAAVRRVVPTLASCYPLGDIDGLNLWYEARLLEEGIEDMQNLATANLVDVILHTRVPVGRLVDWVDQAHLYLHLAPPEKRRRGGWVDGDRGKFRQVGIRTATDLEDAMLGHGSGYVADGALPSLDNPVAQSLNDAWKTEDAVSIASTVLRTLAREPNLRHVRKWREDWYDLELNPPGEKPQTVTVRA